MKKPFLLPLFLRWLVWLGQCLAQTKPAGQRRCAGQPLPAPADAGAIKSQNIFEVKPDASQEPGYATQTNGERAKVQPGNNAPMWRQVGSGVTGYSSLPKRGARGRQSDSALCAVPGLAPDQCRRSLAPGAQQLDHSLWRRAGADRAGCHCAVSLAHWPHEGARRALPAARLSASRRSSVRRTGPTRSPSAFWPFPAW